MDTSLVAARFVDNSFAHHRLHRREMRKMNATALPTRREEWDLLLYNKLLAYIEKTNITSCLTMTRKKRRVTTCSYNVIAAG